MPNPQSCEPGDKGCRRPPAHDARPKPEGQTQTSNRPKKQFSSKKHVTTRLSPKPTNQSDLSDQSMSRRSRAAHASLSCLYYQQCQRARRICGVREKRKISSPQGEGRTRRQNSNDSDVGGAKTIRLEISLRNRRLSAPSGAARRHRRRR